MGAAVRQHNFDRTDVHITSAKEDGYYLGFIESGMHVRRKIWFNKENFYLLNYITKKKLSDKQMEAIDGLWVFDNELVNEIGILQFYKAVPDNTKWIIFNKD